MFLVFKGFDVHLVCFISNSYKQPIFQPVEILEKISNPTPWIQSIKQPKEICWATILNWLNFILAYTTVKKVQNEKLNDYLLSNPAFGMVISNFKEILFKFRKKHVLKQGNNYWKLFY